MARTAALGALLLLLAISTDASITLEHSLDGGKTFTKSGVIEVRVAVSALLPLLEGCCRGAVYHINQQPSKGARQAGRQAVAAAGGGGTRRGTRLHRQALPGQASGRGAGRVCCLLYQASSFMLLSCCLLPLPLCSAAPARQCLSALQ